MIHKSIVVYGILKNELDMRHIRVSMKFWSSETSRNWASSKEMLMKFGRTIYTLYYI